ncbi:MAG: hypothetical protein IPM82_02975 [Saprospiraceae bacterium]|nr:hypothetical protein [Saprospiraceae bacterium]
MATTNRRWLRKQFVAKLFTCLFMALAAQTLAQQPTDNAAPKPEPEKMV